MIEDLIREVGRLSPGHLDPARFLIFGNAFEKRSVFLFEKGVAEPTLVVRIPLGERGFAQCEREYANLLYLHAQEIPGIKCPRPLGTVQMGEHTCFVQGAIIAPSLIEMVPLLGGRPRLRQFSWLADRLAGIYRETRSRDASPEGSDLRCFQHGDFWAGNLGRKKDKLVLHDFEFANRNGRPLYDLLHFGLYFRVVQSNVGKVKMKLRGRAGAPLSDDRKFEPDAETIVQAFLGDSPLARLMRMCIRRYIAECEISDDDAFDLAWRFFTQDRRIMLSDRVEMEQILVD